MPTRPRVISPAQGQVARCWVTDLDTFIISTLFGPQRQLSFHSHSMPPSAHSSSSSKILCPCGCGNTVTQRTALNHLKGKAPVTLQASQAARLSESDDEPAWDLQIEARPVKRFWRHVSFPPEEVELQPPEISHSPSPEPHGHDFVSSKYQEHFCSLDGGSRLRMTRILRKK